MPPDRFATALIVAALTILASVGGALAVAAGDGSGVALTGQVTSPDEGAMEGVLVSARKAGSTITITVVSDRDGRYRFPASRLEPGTYALRIRAVGYDLPGRPTGDVVAGQTATVDLELRRTQDLAAQLTNAEWMLSIPGTPADKSVFYGCVGCHTVERIVRSSYDAAAFLRHVLPRMASYANQSTPLHPQKRLAERALELRGEERERQRRAQAEYLATVNRSGGPWEYTLKTLPRPSGRGTRVLITEYDLPRPTIEPHDVIVDAAGIAWFSNFGEQTFGKLDPKTGKVTEYPVPEPKKGWPTGMLGLRADRGGHMWLGMMYQGAVAKFDPKTEKFQIFPLPAEWNRPNSQVNMVRPESAHVDGKVWTQNNGFAGIHRLDIASGRFETWEPFKDGPKDQVHNIYDVIPDSRNNVYFTDFAQEHLGRIDAKTGKVTFYEVPTKRSAPRRGMMDAQDRLWFAEYRGNKVAMFDTRAEQFQEWTAPTPWSSPYDVAYDKNGEAWTGSMFTDRILRLDPKSSRFTEYLLPRPTNIRRVFVDDSTTPVTFWVGSNHGASIIKLEPLD
jgi:streptogramin lyase